MRRLLAWGVLGWLIIGVGAAWAAAAENTTADALATEPLPAADEGASTMESSTPVSANPMERKVSLDFQDASLKDILKLFSQQSGLNFIADQTVRDRKITLYVDNVSVKDVLDQLLRSNKLSAERPENSNILILREATAEPAASKTITRIYALKYARLSTSVLAKAAANLAGTSSSVSTPASTTSTSTGSSSSSSSSGSSGGTSSKPTGLDLIIQQLLTPQGKLVVDERTNSLIITDIPDNFPKIEDAIARLDVKTQQVLIEVEILEVNASKTKNLGIEWGSGTDGTLATFTPGQSTTRFPFNLVQGQMLGSSSLSAPAQTRAAYTFGTLNASQFQVVLKALQSDQETRLLGHPKVLTLNNEEAIIQLTANTAIGQTTSTTATGGTGNTTTQAERSPTGVTLKVTPQVNDGGQITMFVEPSLSRPVLSEFFPAQFVDPKSRLASTIVRVHDGETIIIGGLIDRQERSTKRQVPGLGKVPFVGGAFRKNDDSYTDTELVVFITPHIMADQADVLAKTPLDLPPLAPEQQPPPAEAASADDRTTAMNATLQQLTTTPSTAGPSSR